MAPASPDRPEPIDLSGSELRAVTGYHAIVEHLKREMALGRLRPGDRLPPERQLAEQLGVARQTLRQALRLLEGAGLVTVTRGAQGGTMVRAVERDQARILQEVVARREELEALLDYREIVECGAARLAAQRHGSEELAAMERAQEEMSRASDLRQARLADTAFHLALAAAAGNDLLASAIEETRVLMFDPVDQLGFDFALNHSLEGHESVLAAVRDRDPDAAERAMRTHIRTTRTDLDAIVEQS